MSAFICGPDLFKSLAIFAAGDDPRLDGRNSRRVDPEWSGLNLSSVDDVATQYADILYQENIRSVRARYPSDAWDDLPGPCEKTLRLIVGAADLDNPALRVPPVWILKLCACLKYQSCETDDYRRRTDLHSLSAAPRELTQALPGNSADLTNRL